MPIIDWVPSSGARVQSQTLFDADNQDTAAEIW